MIRLSFFTDLHLRGQGPISRKDDYSSSILAKLEFCLKRSSESNIALFGGDFCHSYKLASDQVKEKAINLFDTELKVPFLYTWGQHDLHGKDYNTRFDSTKAFILRQASRVIGGIEEIPPDTDIIKEIKGLKIGFISCPNISNLDPIAWSKRISGRKRKKEIDVRIALVHHLLSDNGEDYCIDINQFVTGTRKMRSLDIVFCGDLHQGFNPFTNKNGTLFLNPGSLARTQKLKHDLARPIRGVDVIIDPKTKSWSWELWDVESAKPYDEVFKKEAPFIDESVFIKLSKEKDEIVAEFEDVIEALSSISTSRIDVWDMLEKTAREKELPEEIITYILSKRPDA
jgi:hypothetical protein